MQAIDILQKIEQGIGGVGAEEAKQAREALEADASELHRLLAKEHLDNSQGERAPEEGKAVPVGTPLAEVKQDMAKVEGTTLAVINKLGEHTTQHLDTERRLTVIESFVKRTIQRLGSVVHEDFNDIHEEFTRAVDAVKGDHSSPDPAAQKTNLPEPVVGKTEDPVGGGSQMAGDSNPTQAAPASTASGSASDGSTEQPSNTGPISTSGTQIPEESRSSVASPTTQQPSDLQDPQAKKE